MFLLNFWRSTIGKKVVMAVTGLIGIGFVIGHMVGNLQIFQGPAKMKTLADALGLSARNMTAVADSLEREGLLRRVAHPSDRRAILLELTQDGFAAADESLGPRLAEISTLFEDMSPAERTTFRDTLAVLVRSMESGCDQRLEE